MVTYEHLPAIRHQNEGLVAMARELGLPSNTPFVFLCECRDSSCSDLVKLALTEYETQRRELGFIVCEGHRPPAPAFALAGS